MIPNNSGPKNKWLIFGIVLLVILVGLTLGLRATLGETILGADLYTYWVGGQALLADQNPYSPEVTLQIQTGKYGRPADPGEDQMAFAYPLYGLVLLMPVVWLDFPWAQAAWLAIHLILLSGLISYCFPRSPGLLRVSVFFLYPISLGLILGNLSVLMGGLLLLVFVILERGAAITDKSAWLLGVALALATTKPQLSWLMIFFFLVWAVRQNRKSLIWGFLSSLAALSLFFLALQPAWPLEWVRQISAYTGYDLGDPVVYTLFSALLPAAVAAWASVLVVIFLAVTSVLVFVHWWKKRLSSLLVFGWTGLVTYLVHPNGIAYEQICLYIALFAWAFQPVIVTKRGFLAVWTGLLVFSWLAFYLGNQVLPVFDKIPVLFFGLWLAWLWKKEVTQPPLSPAEPL